MSAIPTNAVSPVIPRTPSAVEIGASRGSTPRIPRPSRTAFSRQPKSCTTHDPSGQRSLRDATTRPTAPPRIGSPSGNGDTYDFASFIRPRMYGSTET